MRPVDEEPKKTKITALIEHRVQIKYLGSFVIKLANSNTSVLESTNKHQTQLRNGNVFQQTRIFKSVKPFTLLCNSNISVFFLFVCLLVLYFREPDKKSTDNF